MKVGNFNGVYRVYDYNALDTAMWANGTWLDCFDWLCVICGVAVNTIQHINTKHTGSGQCVMCMFMWLQVKAIRNTSQL